MRSVFQKIVRILLFWEKYAAHAISEKNSFEFLLKPGNTLKF